MIESQCSVLKSEFYNRYEWDTPAQAIQGVEACIYGFSPPQAGGAPNTRRLNSAIGYQTSAEFEAHRAAALTMAA